MVAESDIPDRAGSPRSWRREPLVHFVLLGAIAAGLYTLSRPAEAASTRDRIVMTEADVAWLEDSGLTTK